MECQDAFLSYSFLHVQDRKIGHNKWVRIDVQFVENCVKESLTTRESGGYYIKYKIFIKCMHFTQFLQWKKLQTSTNDT